MLHIIKYKQFLLRGKGKKQIEIHISLLLLCGWTIEMFSCMLGQEVSR